jgi:hypothetical protein
MTLGYAPHWATGSASIGSIASWANSAKVVGVVVVSGERGCDDRILPLSTASYISSMLHQQVLEEESRPQVNDAVGGVAQESFDVVQAADQPDTRVQVGPDRRQIDHPRNPVGADGGGPGLAEAILKRPHAIGAEAGGRDPEEGVAVPGSLDQVVRVVLGADGRMISVARFPGGSDRWSVPGFAWYTPAVSVLQSIKESVR